MDSSSLELPYGQLIARHRHGVREVVSYRIEDESLVARFDTKMHGIQCTLVRILRVSKPDDVSIEKALTKAGDEIHSLFSQAEWGAPDVSTRTFETVGLTQ